jgi:hypothetical protein
VHLLKDTVCISILFVIIMKNLILLMHFEYNSLMFYSSNILYILDAQHKFPCLHTVDRYHICDSKK